MSRAGTAGDEWRHSLIDIPTHVFLTILKVPARRKLVGMPDQINIKGRDEEIRRGGRHQIKESVARVQAFTIEPQEGSLRVVSRDGVVQDDAVFL
jgi:hypothetical protein